MKFSFYLWMGLLVPESGDSVIAELVRYGYGVKPMSNAPYLTRDDNLCCVMSLEISKEFDNGDIETEKSLDQRSNYVDAARKLLGRDLSEIIRDTGVRLYMYVITDYGSGCAWNVGNLTRPEKKRAKQHDHLRLVKDEGEKET